MSAGGEKIHFECWEGAEEDVQEYLPPVQVKRRMSIWHSATTEKLHRRSQRPYIVFTATKVSFVLYAHHSSTTKEVIRDTYILLVSANIS